MIPLPPNPLLPVVQEMAERIVELEKRTTGKLWARCSTEGPQSVDELRVLLGRNGMWAAAWILEKTWDVEDDLNDADAELEQAEERIKALEAEVEEAKGAALALEKKLSYIHQLTKGNEDDPTTSRTD